MTNKHYLILAINPGSTSTKIAVYEDEQELFSLNVEHDADVLKQFADVQDQLEYRKKTIVEALEDKGIDVSSIDVYVGRGGGLVAVDSGAFVVTDRLLEDARKGMAGQHPAQLGSQICDALAAQYGGKAYIYNAPDVDEYDSIARVSGLKGVYRQCHIHTLNQKEIALRYASEHDLDYDKINLIICHIGGGISVTAHRQGRMVDGNDIIRGEGPMTPTRAGSLPTIDMLDLCFRDGADKKAIKDRLTKNGGLIDHLGTADAREVEQRIKNGDAYAQIVYDAMLYQVAKSVGACAATLTGELEAIILTGGMAHSEYIVDFLREYIGWIAPLVVMPGEFEMEALAAGALRVARGEEEPKLYTGTPVWNGF
ncbi:MAG: butyrate kinase [Coriobacteriales bacterium]|jgi:butyrate kinase|nr:butyrate kinase [Coriobacteriales bacterium]